MVLCQQLLQELLDSFFPGHTQKAPEVLQRQSAQPDNYTPIDTAQQYLDIFAAMQKRSSWLLISLPIFIDFSNLNLINIQKYSNEFPFKEL